ARRPGNDRAEPGPTIRLSVKRPPRRATGLGPQDRRATRSRVMSATTRSQPVRLGLRANLGQFALLVGVNALVGGMVGQERSVLPLLATDVFGLTGVTAILTFLLAFGVTKAGANVLAGALADRYGRR